MSKSKPIQVFEHDKLKIGDQGFEEKHWKALGWYNERYEGRYFSLTPNGVKFNQYVGVIQAGSLTIEVLPKIGKTVQKADIWQKVLIEMLRECRWMNVYSNEKASLRFKPNSILEAYLEMFLLKCEDLIREGLVKKYRTKDCNSNALKGKLLFNKQIQKNSIHNERFYTRHQVYDKENLYNQILLKALKLIPTICSNSVIKDSVYSLLFSFPELDDIVVNQDTFNKLIFERKTIRYKEAIEIAAMLILNYRPDVSSGSNHVLAILFDMNDLWEEYFYRQLYKHKPATWEIRSQCSKKFWESENTIKCIRPDIVLEDSQTKKTIIFDTKWKLPDNNKPSDNDLKQMYVYDEYWNSTNAILVYPNATFQETPEYVGGQFLKKNSLNLPQYCGLMWTSVLDKYNKNLDQNMGNRIREFLKEEFGISIL